MGIGSLPCPYCGEGIRAAFQSAPSNLSIVVDKRDLALRHATCLRGPSGGERLSA